MVTKRILCAPAVESKLQSMQQLGKYRGVALLEGEYPHTTLPYKVSATREFMQDLADKWNTHRKHIEVPTPEGHTTEASKNRGYLDRDGEAKIIDVEIDGVKRAGLELPFDIRDSETNRAAAAGTLGRSVGIEDDFRYSTPDGAIHSIGVALNHVAFTSYPIVANMPPLEPVREFSKDGSELEFVPLADMKTMASRLVTWQDPPADVADGSRRATHQECGYTAGTPEANCDRCLSRYYELPSDASATNAGIHCEWVGDPIKVSGVCKYFRPRYYSYSVSVPDDCVMLAADSGPVLVQLAKDPKKPYGDVTYADNGMRPDGVHRYPLDTAEHVAAAARYFGMPKNRNKYSSKQQSAIDSAIKTAEKKFKIGTSADKGDSQMDLKQLAKELGVSESEDVKEFAKSVTEAADKRATERVTEATIVAFAKTGFGVEVKDASKAAEAIKTELAKPHAETTQQLSKLTADLAQRDEQLKSLAKSVDDANKREFERTITEQLSSAQTRIAVCKELGKMTKADEERILTIATEGDQPIKFTFQFAKDAKYDNAWQRNLDRLIAKIEEFEARKPQSAVPGEKTKKNLGKGGEDGDGGAGTDAEGKPTEEALDKFWGKKKKQVAA